MKKQYLGLILVLVVISLILGAFILYNEWPFLTGKRMVLASQPVDPFDLFRGQYMIIGYEISRLESTEQFDVGDSIFVSLKNDNQNIWRNTGVAKTKPDSGDFIKGQVVDVIGGELQVEYGIEQFFFERNAEFDTDNLTVEIVVDMSGRSKILQLLNNGKPIEIKYPEFNIEN